MSAKRYKDQILSLILQICQGDGASKTQVVYGSGLNFCTIKPYLATLDKSGLVEIVPGSYPLYRITQRGEDALVHLKALEELIPEFAPVEQAVRED
jgi:predicted transcriptional regulator